jgi:hypothetical protein
MDSTFADGRNQSAKLAGRFSRNAATASGTAGE